MAQQRDDWGKKWASIVAQAWADEKFKKRLLSDPAGVLKEKGLSVGPGVGVKVVEDTDEVAHLTLPQKPDSDELAGELERIAAGGTFHLVVTKD